MMKDELSRQHMDVEANELLDKKSENEEGTDTVTKHKL